MKSRNKSLQEKRFSMTHICREWWKSSCVKQKFTIATCAATEYPPQSKCTWALSTNFCFWLHESCISDYSCMVITHCLHAVSGLTCAIPSKGCFVVCCSLAGLCLVTQGDPQLLWQSLPCMLFPPGSLYPLTFPLVCTISSTLPSSF